MSHCSRGMTMVVLNALLSVTAASAEPLDRLLRAEIESLSARLTDGFATFDHADAHYAARSTPLANHVVVLFGLTSWGGGNGSRQFMAVVRRNDESIEFPDGRRARPYQLMGVVQIGSDFDRWFKTVELRKDRVVRSGRRWTNRDAHCCPSLDVHAAYQISERGLNEVTR
jgi:hypothetical protein